LIEVHEVPLAPVVVPRAAVPFHAIAAVVVRFAAAPAGVEVIIEAPPPCVADGFCIALGCRIRVASSPLRHAGLLACGLIYAMNFGNVIAHKQRFWQGTSEIFSDAVVPCGFELTLRVVLSTHNLAIRAVHRATNTFRVAGHLGLAVQRVARLVDRGRIRISVGPALVRRR